MRIPMHFIAASVALLAISAVLVLAPRASADPDKTVGAPLGFAAQTFPAGQPFNINHGWLLAPRFTDAMGEYRVALAVDGVEMRSDFVETTRRPDPVFGT